MEKQIIDLAYDLAKTKFNKKAFTFKELWTKLVKQARLDKDEQEQAGYVYTTMLQDNRFIFIGDSQWKIAEFLTQAEIDEYANALYDFKQDEEEARAKKLDKDDDYLYQDSETDEEYGQKTSGSFDDDEEVEDDDGEEDEEGSESEDDDEEDERSSK